MTTLIGQWFGSLSGGSTGSALLYIERVGTQLQGRILVYEGEPRIAYSLFVTVISADLPKSTAVAKLDYFLNLQTRRLEPIQDHAETARQRELPPQVEIAFAITPDGRGLDAS